MGRGGFVARVVVGKVRKIIPSARSSEKVGCWWCRRIKPYTPSKYLLITVSEPDRDESQVPVRRGEIQY